MERARPLQRLRQIEELGPRRVTGTPLEKKAQELLGDELTPLGFTQDWRPFKYTQSIYFALMVTFGLSVLGTGLAFSVPVAALALHALVAVSYALESLRRGLIIRSFIPSISSQNLLCTLKAKAPLRKRIVLLAHVDAAFTGVLFHPSVVKVATKQPPPGLGWFKKGLGIATSSVALLALFDGLGLAGLWAPPLWLYLGLAVPSTIVFLLNVDVVVRNTVVPGAADNLSGCTACSELAYRLAGSLPDDVELVIVYTGCEEAGTGGALRLAQQLEVSGEWKKEETVVLALDTLTNGELRYLEEGELWPIAVPKVLVEAIEATNADSPQKVTRYVVPTGASDSLPFVVRGWNTVCLSCIDPVLGAPRHYHRPSDTWSNCDEQQLDVSIDFAEKLIRRLAAR